MYAFLTHSFHFEPSRQVQSITVFAWLKQRLEALRQKQAAKREIQYLRTLDRNTLADMGVDILALGRSPPSLASFNPKMIAMGLISSPSSRGSL